MNAAVKTQVMDWAKYTIDGWLEQFGAWCETVRMKGGDLPDGLHVNQIYWLIREADKTPRNSKCYIKCEINDFEAEQVRKLIVDFNKSSSVCASAKVAVQLFIEKNVRGMSLSQMEREFTLSRSSINNMVFAGSYYLAGHDKRLRLK